MAAHDSVICRFRRERDCVAILRYNGNGSVHPGEINLSDNRDDALLLFTLPNMIADEFFTTDARPEELYQQIPERRRV